MINEHEVILVCDQEAFGTIMKLNRERESWWKPNNVDKRHIQAEAVISFGSVKKQHAAPPSLVSTRCLCCRGVQMHYPLLDLNLTS